MPAALEKALRNSARKKGMKPGSERWRRYVYGALEKWKKKHHKK